MNRETHEKHEILLFREESYAIQGAIFDIYREMVLNYLKVTGLELGLLVNFGSYPKVEIVRIANSNFRDFSAFRG